MDTGWWIALRTRKANGRYSVLIVNVLMQKVIPKTGCRKEINKEINKMPYRYQRAWMWIKLYLRMPQLLYSQLGREVGFTEPRLMVARVAMDSVVLALPIFFVAWPLFGKYIAAGVFQISAGLLFIYGTFFSSGRDALSESKKLRAEGVWFPDCLVASRLYLFLLIAIGGVLQLIIVILVIIMIALMTR